MGLLSRALGIAVCCALLLAVPAQAQVPVAADEEEDVRDRKDRLRLIAVTVHQREVCAAGACTLEPRRGYGWAKVAGYAASSVAYARILLLDRDDRLSIGVGPGGVSARVSW